MAVWSGDLPSPLMAIFARYKSGWTMSAAMPLFVCLSYLQIVQNTCKRRTSNSDRLNFIKPSTSNAREVFFDGSWKTL